MKVDAYLSQYKKNNSKWIKELNVRAQTTKLLENLEPNLNDLGFGKEFLHMTPKTSKTQKKQIEKLDFSKIKNFCTSKDNSIKKVKKQPTEWEKISANYVSGKRLLSTIYKELLQFNDKKTA